jgi:hypothetical protein
MRNVKCDGVLPARLEFARVNEAHEDIADVGAVGVLKNMAFFLCRMAFFSPLSKTLDCLAEAGVGFSLPFR